MFVDIYSPPQTARNSIIRSTIVVGYMFIPSTNNGILILLLLLFAAAILQFYGTKRLYEQYLELMPAHLAVQQYTVPFAEVLRLSAGRLLAKATILTNILINILSFAVILDLCALCVVEIASFGNSALIREHSQQEKYTPLLFSSKGEQVRLIALSILYVVAAIPALAKENDYLHEIASRGRELMFIIAALFLSIYAVYLNFTQPRHSVSNNKIVFDFSILEAFGILFFSLYCGDYFSIIAQFRDNHLERQQTSNLLYKICEDLIFIYACVAILASFVFPGTHYDSLIQNFLQTPMKYVLLAYAPMMLLYVPYRTIQMRTEVLQEFVEKDVAQTRKAKLIVSLSVITVAFLMALAAGQDVAILANFAGVLSAFIVLALPKIIDSQMHGSVAQAAVYFLLWTGVSVGSVTIGIIRQIEKR